MMLPGFAKVALVLVAFLYLEVVAPVSGVVAALWPLLQLLVLGVPWAQLWASSASHHLPVSTRA
jgi:hypothetical protein